MVLIPTWIWYGSSLMPDSFSTLDLGSSRSSWVRTAAFSAKTNCALSTSWVWSDWVGRFLPRDICFELRYVDKHLHSLKLNTSPRRLAHRTHFRKWVANAWEQNTDNTKVADKTWGFQEYSPEVHKLAPEQWYLERLLCRELTYPIPRHFKVGYVSSLEGTLIFFWELSFFSGENEAVKLHHQSPDGTPQSYDVSDKYMTGTFEPNSLLQMTQSQGNSRLLSLEGFNLQRWENVFLA